MVKIDRSGARGRRRMCASAYRNTTALGLCMACALSLAAVPARAGGALPTNGQYMQGQGAITSAANSVTVNQSSSHGIINWQTFSIGQGNSVLVYATGSVGTATATDVGGLVGSNGGTVNDAYAATYVVGDAGTTGALVGFNTFGSSVTNAYFDAALSGSLPGAAVNLGTLQVETTGGTGEPDPAQQFTYAGFDFTFVWTIPPGDLPTLIHAP